MDKRIECAMNELINAEIWSTNLYLSLQVYFEEHQLPILGSWLNTQAQENMNRTFRLMGRIYCSNGCVAIHEIKREPQKWETALDALNHLLRHEQYMYGLITSLFTLARHVDYSSYLFVKGLYEHRIYVSTVFVELLHVLAREGGRRLPWLSDWEQD